MDEMIDHLVTFNNENQAHAILLNLGFSFIGQGGEKLWDTRRVDPGIKLTTVEAVWDETDPHDPILITPEQTISGFHISIGLDVASDELEALPGKVLRLIENRGIATSSSKFHEYAVAHKSLPEGVASNMQAGNLNRVGGKIDSLNFKVSPRFLGSDYPVTI